MKSPDKTEQVLVDDGVKLAVYQWRARCGPPAHRIACWRQHTCTPAAMPHHRVQSISRRRVKPDADAAVRKCRAEPPPDIPERIAVVLVHQYSKMGGCSALMRGMAASIACRGLPVITFDLRGVGRSTGRSTFTGSHEVKDVEAVCAWVHRSLDLRVLLVGSSAGALALMTALFRRLKGLR